MSIFNIPISLGAMSSLLRPDDIGFVVTKRLSDDYGKRVEWWEDEFRNVLGNAYCPSRLIFLFGHREACKRLVGGISNANGEFAESLEDLDGVSRPLPKAIYIANTHEDVAGAADFQSVGLYFNDAVALANFAKRHSKTLTCRERDELPLLPIGPRIAYQLARSFFDDGKRKADPQ